MLDFVRLLDLDAHADRIHARLYQHAFVLVSGYGEGVQENLGGFRSFDFRNVVTFRGLAGEVAEGYRGGQGGANAF